MKRSWRGLAALLAIFAAVSSAPAQQPPARTIAIKCRRLLDVRNGGEIERPVILVVGDRIKAVGPMVDIPANAEVIDLGAMRVLPGLIDGHTHLTMEAGQFGYSTLGISVPRSALSGAKNARLTLEAGFTTVRNVGADGHADIALRSALRELPSEKDGEAEGRATSSTDYTDSK